MASDEHPRHHQPHHKNPLPDRLDFFSIPEPNTGCILWIGGIASDGYGRVSAHGKNVPAHRAAWENKNGSIPLGLNILHRCDTPLCINPEHLFPGSQADNMADMASKGRRASRHGMANHVSRLTDDDVREIRASSEPQSTIARKFGITQPVVSRIKARKRWGHIE